MQFALHMVFLSANWYRHGGNTETVASIDCLAKQWCMNRRSDCPGLVGTNRLEDAPNVGVHQG
jgi:hypothetical protein